MYASDGVWVSELGGAVSPVKLALRSWGREAAVVRVDAVIPRRGECRFRCERHVDYVRGGGLVEWWEERRGEIEQGFTIESPPAGDGLLVFDLVVDGADVVMPLGHATNATFARPGAPHLYYTGLAAWDETGRALRAWMADAPDGVRLIVDDTAARGSVTVDPVLTEAWSAESDQGGADFGIVSSAGDVNGDGYGDVIVGAPDFGPNLPGGAFLYVGSASGLEATATWTAVSDQENEVFGTRPGFGQSVSEAGDVNGDGYDDVIVGAPAYDNPTPDAGAAFVYLGWASGLETAAAWQSDEEVELPTDDTGNVHSDLPSYGWSVSSAGDVNGDSFADVLVGAPFFDHEENDEGKAFLYHGSVSGPAATVSWTAEVDQDEALFGWSVSSAGDVNGDGYSDVIVGAPNFDSGVDCCSTNHGTANLYLGSASGLETSASWTVVSDGGLDEYGTSVSDAGDVNGDGYGDVVVGAPGYGDGDHKGGAFLYLGSTSGLETTASWSAQRDQLRAYFGNAVSSAGDVNGDGYGDVVVGAADQEQGELRVSGGHVFVYLGSTSGLERTAVWSQESRNPRDYELYGISVSTAGDVNGDGYGDVVVGAPQYDNGQGDEGAAYLYLGGLHDPDLDGVPFPTDICPHVADPGQEDADGDGVGDACVPLVLTMVEVSVSVSEGLINVEIDGALPGETVSVVLGKGPPEIGPCNQNRAQMCLDVGDERQRWDVVADATGHASLVGGALQAPMKEGTLVTVQAAAARGEGGVKSDPIETTAVF